MNDHRWPISEGMWTRDGERFEVLQSYDGEFWVKVSEEEYVPGMLAGLANLRDRWVQAKQDDPCMAAFNELAKTDYTAESWEEDIAKSSSAPYYFRQGYLAAQVAMGEGRS